MTVGSKYHVLAVDDSLVDRKLIERILRTSSFHVTVVESGSKALEVLGLQESDDEHNENISRPELLLKVNMIITDYSMSGMTGYDLLKKIKGSKSLKGIPVVIMSSENITTRINKCKEEGAEEFLLKPVRLSDIAKIKPYFLENL